MDSECGKADGEVALRAATRFLAFLLSRRLSEGSPSLNARDAAALVRLLQSVGEWLGFRVQAGPAGSSEP